MRKVCTLDECDGDYYAKGYCRLHYIRFIHKPRQEGKPQTPAPGYNDKEGKPTGRPPKVKNIVKPSVVIPARPFLYTLDQVAAIMSISERELIGVYLFLEGRSTFPRSPHHITARNIAPPDDEPEWRVAEPELLRWLRSLGFVYRSAGRLSTEQ